MIATGLGSDCSHVMSCVESEYHKSFWALLRSDEKVNSGFAASIVSRKP